MKGHKAAEVVALLVRVGEEGLCAGREFGRRVVLSCVEKVQNEEELGSTGRKVPT